MPDYSKGKIYRIVCNETGEQYIGSTTQSLAVRMAKHKCDTKCSKNRCKSKQIIERGNYAMVLIEECPCENKEQLGRRERHFIETMDCVNMIIPTRTKKEWADDNHEKISERQREYHTSNKEKILEYQRKYYEANKEKKLEQSREYYEANKEKKLEQQRKYDTVNKEKILENQRKRRAAKKLEKTHDGNKCT